MESVQIGGKGRARSTVSAPPPALFGLLYAFGAVYGIAQLFTAREKVPTLVGLAVGGTFAWFYLKAAANVKVPPSK